MSRVIHRHWPGNPDAPSRPARTACDYDAYGPDLLTDRQFTLEGGVAADVADAETAIARLNAEASALADTEALARLLLRAESVASSRIEGLEIGARRLLRAEAAKELGEPTRDVTAAEVLSNIDAMSAAISEIGPGDPISVTTLLTFTSGCSEIPGRPRTPAGSGRNRTGSVAATTAPARRPSSRPRPSLCPS